MRILRCGGVASPHLRRSYDRGIFSFKKIIGDYETQYNYHDEFSPIFKSQNDSFILILKNLNYNSKITNRVENRVEKKQMKCFRVIKILRQ